MKKTLTLSLFLTINTALLAQPSFQRHYGQPSNFDECIGLVPTQDGHYLIAGTTANFGAGGLDMLFEKVDDNGNSLWQATWGGSGNDGTNHIIPISTGGFLVSGFTQGGELDRDFVAVRLDEAGEELWRIVRGGEYDDEGLLSMELPGGGLLLLGRIVQPGLTEAGLLLLRTDADGTPEWEQTLYPPFGLNLIGATTAEDGGYFLLLMPNYLMKLDEQGNLQWFEEITDWDGWPVNAGAFGRTSDGQLWAGGYAEATDEPFLAALTEYGENSLYLELSNIEPYAQVNSFALTPGSKLWVTVSPLYGALFPGATLLYAIDPLAGEVIEEKTGEQLGLAGIDDPYAVFAAQNGEGFLITGNSFSNAKGDNGLVFRGGEFGNENWRKVFGVEGVDDREAGRMVVETNEGGFLLAGTWATATEERNLWLIRTNASGNVQWSADIGSEQRESVAGLAARADGSFVVAGYRSDTLVVSAVGETGAPLWYREYGIGLGDGTFGIHTTPDNEILLAMPTIQGDELKGLLLKLDPGGEILWAQYYQPSLEYSATYGVTASANGGYYLCGCAQNENGEIAPLLLETDESGNEVWSMTYDPIGYFTCPITVHQSPNGDLFVNGVNLGGGTRPYVLRTDSEGGLKWSKVLELDVEETGYFTWFSDLRPNTGQLVLFGRKTFNSPLLSQSRFSAAITSLFPDGAVAWERDFGRPMNALFQGGAVTSDGGLIAVGTATFDNSQDAWLVKTEPDGTVGFSAPLAPPFQLRCAPNPADEWLQVQAEGLAEEEVLLSVFNLNGQRLHVEALAVVGGQLSHTILVEELPKGGYVLHVQQGGKAVAVKWVKQ